MLQRVDLVHEIVAGRAVGLPLPAQLLVSRQDFFDDEISRALGRIRRPLGFQAVEPRAQLPAVGPGLRQAVDMIDTHAIDQALRVEPEHGCVHGIEDFVDLDAQGNQIVDVEKAPPVDLVVGQAPPGEAVILILQDLVQTARGLAASPDR